MNKLITKSLEEQSLYHLLLMPDLLLTDNEKEIVKWCLDYTGKHGQTPNVGRLKSQFPHFVELKSKDPITDIFEQTRNERQATFFVNASSLLVAETQSNGEVPLQALNDMVQSVYTMQAGIKRYTLFDRGEYTQEKNILSYGIERIDDLTGGIHEDDFVLLAGRLGNGKSQLLLWIAYQLFKADKRVMLVTKEMSPKSLFARLDAMAGSFNHMDLRDPQTAKGKASLLGKIQSKVKGAKGEIFIQEARTPAEAMYVASALNADCVLIDGLYLMQSTGYSKNKWERIGLVSTELREWVLEYELPVVATTQINREGKDASNRDASNLYGSDSLGHDPTLILSVEMEKSDKEPSKAIWEIQSLKVRSGPAFNALLEVDFSTSYVKDLSASFS